MTTPVERSSLDRSLIQGIVWTGGVKWLVQLVTWASTLVVARILTPEDYGLVSMATTYLGLITIVSEFGIGTAVLTLRDLSEQQLRQINSLSLLFGLASFGISCLAAYPIAQFFRAPQLPPVIIALSLSFVIASARTVPNALMQRGLRFKRLAAIDGIRGFATALGALAFALLGFRYWTLVASALLGTSIATVLIVASNPHGFAKPRLGDLKESLTFSTHTIVGRVSWYAYQNSDFIVAGRVLGKAALGAYSFGWQLASMPLEKITTMVMQVTPAIFSAAQKDVAALRRYVLVITEALALATYPAVVGLALVAPELVLIALGEKWRAMILPLQILALFSTVRALAPLLAQIFAVTGETRYAMFLNLTAAIVHPIAFLVGARLGGVGGIAWAWLAAYPLFVVLPLTRRVFKRLELTWPRYLAAVQPAAISSVLMAAAVIGTRYLLPASLSRIAVLGSLITVGASVYGLALFTLFRHRLESFKSAWRAIRR